MGKQQLCTSSDSRENLLWEEGGSGSTSTDMLEVTTRCGRNMRRVLGGLGG